MPTASSKQTSKELSTYLPPTDTTLNNPVQEFENKHRTYKEFRAKGLDKQGLNANDYDERGQLIILPNGAPSSVEEQVINKFAFRSIRKHLVRIDLTKGPIRRKIQSMQRRRAYSVEKKKWVEYLVSRVHWLGKDYLGNDVEVTGVLEGFYNEPVLETKIVRGKTETRYRQWNAKYDIEFTPEVLDESINMENQEQPPELIKFYLIMPTGGRDDRFTYQQFRDSTWEELQTISKGK